MKIILYDIQYKELWDSFIDTSKNGTFLHKRDYMEYHSDRFRDFSLIIFDDNESVAALLPANIADDKVYSHRGLTYGGLILTSDISLITVKKIFEDLKMFFAGRGVTTFYYKAIPSVYHKIPSDEDIYSLFCIGACITDRKASSAILQGDKLRINNSRRKGVKRAVNHGIKLSEDPDIDAFWTLLGENLNSRFDVDPVHTTEEIKKLKASFPENIILHTAELEGETIAGVLVYLTETCAHAQYTSASPKGKKINAGDFLYETLINKIYTDKRWFDFGVSTEPYDCKILNEGLLSQKESFGARTIVYDTYEIKTL